MPGSRHPCLAARPVHVSPPARLSPLPSSRLPQVGALCEGAGRDGGALQGRLRAVIPRGGDDTQGTLASGYPEGGRGGAPDLAGFTGVPGFAGVVDGTLGFLGDQRPRSAGSRGAFGALCEAMMVRRLPRCWRGPSELACCALWACSCDRHAPRSFLSQERRVWQAQPPSPYLKARPSVSRRTTSAT
jgi:hypothetical protein